MPRIGLVFASGLHDFFNSGTWQVIRNLALLLVVIFWVATVYWVYKDARRRVDDPWLVAVATAIGIVPFVGPLIYMLFRPPEYLEDVRERELEIKAMEERLARRDLHCPVCRAEVSQEFLVCPVCTTKLKQARSSCRRFRRRAGSGAEPSRLPRSMAAERTLVLVKPDAVKRRLAGEILGRF